MFIRTVKVTSSAGAVHEYVRVVEAYRHRGKSKQRVVANLGRKDVLTDLLPHLTRVLRGEPVADGHAQPNPVEASTWGPVLATGALFEQLGLFDILDRLLGSTTDVPPADRVLALVANRLVRPKSEHGLASWLETDFVCDRQGRRFLPQWKKHGRVRVDQGQLQAWYRTLDRLHAAKDQIEQALYERLCDLFSLQPDMVLYDVTSTYFEGRGDPALCKHGHSRDGKPRSPQVIVGVVMVNGWPIAHHVFAGNTGDRFTVESVLKDLETRFSFKRIVFVGDRGMVNPQNMEALRKGGHGYLWGVRRRRNPDVIKWIDRLRQENWIECPVGITASERIDPPQTFVQEVESDDPDCRVFVIKSDERKEYEQAEREKAMARVHSDLERLERRVARGQIKKPEVIGAAAGRILQRHHGYRYFDWELRDGKFRFFEHANLQREKKYEGTYVITTTEQGLSALEAVRIYKELAEIERGFRSLKDLVGMRPIYHRTERRIRAHIFVAALALLMHRLLERRLKDAGVDLSAESALEALQTVRHVTFDLDGTRKTGVTPGSPQAQQVLKALGIEDRQPPTPSGRHQTAP